MNILLAGGTGFVGRNLIKELLSSGHEVTLITRRPGQLELPSIGWETKDLYAAVDSCDAVINLVGEPVLGKRWNAKQKKSLIESRVGSTEKLVAAMEHAQKKPGCFINASAIGFYGPRGNEDLTEESEAGDDFLAELSEKWEGAALKAESLGVRTVVVRIGIVLGREGGALARMLLPFKLGMGGPLGNGRQFMSWIHQSDLARLFVFLLKREKAQGIFNGTAPAPVTNAEFSKILAGILRRPAFLFVPGFILNLVFGEAAKILLTGQKVFPERALKENFEFRFPNLEGALRDLLS